jgi:hypothetical protein
MGTDIAGNPVSQNAVSGEDGSFVGGPLPLGTYTATVSSPPPAPATPGGRYTTNRCDGTISEVATTGSQQLSCTLALTEASATKTASFAYSCAGVRVDSATPLAEASFGSLLDTPVQIKGAGFCAGTTVRFGNERAVVTVPSADLAADGSSATVLVPQLATTGKLTVKANGAEGSLADPFAIDSFRDTNGFAFPNTGHITNLDEFEAAFGLEQTMMLKRVPGCPPGECKLVEVPKPQARAFFTSKAAGAADRGGSSRAMGGRAAARGGRAAARGGRAAARGGRAAARGGRATTTTLSLIAHTAGGDHTAVISGAGLDAGLRLAFDRSADRVTLAVAGSHGGSYTVALSGDGGRGLPETFTSPPLALRGGSTLTLSPRSWSSLSGARVSATLTGGGHRARRLRLRDRTRAPRSAIVALADAHGALHAKLRVPALPATSSIHVFLTVAAGKKVLSTSEATVPAGVAGVRSLSFALPARLAAGARARVLALTLGGGPVPTASTVARTLRLRR